MRDGKVAIYGIQFDFEGADIQPQSAAQMEELASLLSVNEALRVLIVAHTEARTLLLQHAPVAAAREAVVEHWPAAMASRARDCTPWAPAWSPPWPRTGPKRGRARKPPVEIVELLGY